MIALILAKVEVNEERNLFINRLLQEKLDVHIIQLHRNTYSLRNETLKSLQANTTYDQ